nr:phenylalanine--tRNA ligase subunit beta [Sulfurovaceae bacterium]
MIVTKNWLSEFVNLDEVSNQKLYDTFNSIGLEVDSIKTYNIPKKVVVGKIISCKKHPNADKLNICHIDIGGGEIKQIVCGASNVIDASFVAVAMVGAVLSENFEIKDALLRGVDSEGMVCASSELGLPDMGKGIMILDDSIGELIIGKELGSYINFTDTIIELELTANRGDCLSIYGVARDLSVALEREIKPFSYQSRHKEKLGVARVADIQSKGNINGNLNYALANITAINTSFLLNLRLSMINISLGDNLSNILAYATHTTGVILRGYNAESLKNTQDRIKIKVESNGYGIVAISSQEKELSILGVNQNLSTLAKSGDSLILLEASYIYPDTLVEAVSKGSYAKDDLYYKTSRGSEPNIGFGLEFVTKLLEKYSSCKCYEGYLSAASDWENIRLGINLKDINIIIGKEISKRYVMTTLTSLGFEIHNSAEDSFVAIIPRFRHDIKNIQDITEEIVRMVGINNIPSKPLFFMEKNRLNN